MSLDESSNDHSLETDICFIVELYPTVNEYVNYFPRNKKVGQIWVVLLGIPDGDPHPV